MKDDGTPTASARARSTLGAASFEHRARQGTVPFTYWRVERAATKSTGNAEGRPRIATFGVILFSASSPVEDSNRLASDRGRRS
ncbi:hypothetical protein J6497_14440 [Bradyrhizobium sp. CNPSo 4026]|nr:hypothetical protein [Bradyrhizobium cenepequi]